MRSTVAVVALALLTTSPALADQATVDAAIAAMIANANQVIAAKKAKALADAETWAALCNRMGDIRVGLTRQGIQRTCWGTRKPLRINETVTAGHKHEQWVYRSSYLYLTDGVVTAYQQSR